MIGDLLDLVDLGDKRDAYVQGLSRGMQQRLCLAHTLVHDPRCCSSTSRPRASTRGPGSSCGSCSASSGRWARRS